MVYEYGNRFNMFVRPQGYTDLNITFVRLQENSRFHLRVNSAEEDHVIQSKAPEP